MSSGFLGKLAAFTGIDHTQVSHKEKLVALVGSFVGIFCVFITSLHFVGLTGAAMVVASIGSSAVLIFAIPNSTLSQPWPVIGGHLTAALIGVTVQKMIGDPALAAAIAVALATGAMHYLRCLHPPAGATALTPIIGGPGVIALGYEFVITPVLLNMLILTVVAIIFNYPFKWRRYPTVLAVREPGPAASEVPAKPEPAPEPGATSGISPQDLVFALSQIDAFVDVTESDLLRIFDLATAHAQVDEVQAEHVCTGRFYSNGDYGENWAIREIVNATPAPQSIDDVFSYNIVAGPNAGASGVCNRGEFTQWARYQVEKVGNAWLPVSDSRPR